MVITGCLCVFIPSSFRRAHHLWNFLAAGKRDAARQQCCQKEIDRTISSRRILVNYIIFVISFTNNGQLLPFLSHFSLNLTKNDSKSIRRKRVLTTRCQKGQKLFPGMHIGPYEPKGGTIQDHRGPYWTIENHTGPTGPQGTILDPRATQGTIEVPTGPYETLRDNIQPKGTIGDHSQSYRIIREHTGPIGDHWRS